MRELSLTEKAKFLASLTVGRSVTAACAEASVPRKTVYYWRSEDESFKDAWDDAKTASLESLEDELRIRALDRDDSKSHILLMFLLKKLDASYKDSYKEPEKKSAHKAQVFDFSDEEIDTAKAILELAKARPKEVF